VARKISAVLVVLLCRSATASDPYVKITQAAGKNGSGTGCSSGTLIGWTTDCSKGIFLSCAHGYDSDHAVEVEINRERTVEGRIIAINHSFDLSLIAAPIERSVDMVYLADRSPRERDEVGMIGFPAKKFSRSATRIAGRFWSRGACTREWKLYEAQRSRTCPEGYQELLVTKAATAQGLSGGAVLRNQRLAGVVIGRITNAGDAGLVVPAETVRLFVRRNIALFYRG
jgi:S1-C subfamily serine protease